MEVVRAAAAGVVAAAGAAETGTPDAAETGTPADAAETGMGATIVGAIIIVGLAERVADGITHPKVHWSRRASSFWCEDVAEEGGGTVYLMFCGRGILVE